MRKQTAVTAVCLCIAIILSPLLTPYRIAFAAESLAPVKAIEKPKEGFSAPRFSLQGLDGSTYSVGGTRSKPLILNFWASWCGPCIMEAPDLNELYQSYQSQLDLYGINATAYDREAGARAFVDEQKLAFPILMDISGSVTNLYKINSFPTSLIVDKRGIIVQRITGVITRDEWEARLKPYL